jgi:hypothetical protein
MCGLPTIPKTWRVSHNPFLDTSSRQGLCNFGGFLLEFAAQHLRDHSEEFTRFGWVWKHSHPSPRPGTAPGPPPQGRSKLTRAAAFSRWVQSPRLRHRRPADIANQLFRTLPAIDRELNPPADKDATS